MTDYVRWMLFVACLCVFTLSGSEEAPSLAEVAPVVQSAPAQPVTVVDPGAVEAMTSSAVTPTAEALLVETEKQLVG